MTRTVRYHLFLLLLAVSVVPELRAQDVLPPPRNVAEFGGLAHRYGNKNPDAYAIDPWNGGYLRVQLASGRRNLWLGEVVAEHRPGSADVLGGERPGSAEMGVAYKLEYVVDRPAWFARPGFRTSTSGSFNPEWRADLLLGVKVGEEKRLLLMGSGFHQKIRDGHEDTGLGAEFQVYGNKEWILQGGARMTYSRPGGSWAPYFHTALTLGRYGERYVTAYGASGSESYDVVNPLNTHFDFRSWTVQLTWREWLSRKVGFTVSGIWYDNEYYRRGGIEAGLFIHFGER